MNKLFVSGFPLEITELELARLIAPYGDIDTLKIVYDRKTRICKGYAFVEMQTPDGAAQAVGILDGAEMGDRQLTLNLVAEEPLASEVSSSRFVQPRITARKANTIAGYNEDKKNRPRRIV